MFQDIKEYGLGEIMVHHIHAYDEALELAKELEEKLKIKVGICWMGKDYWNPCWARCNWYCVLYRKKYEIKDNNYSKINDKVC